MYEDTYQHKGLRRRLVAKLQEKGIHSQSVLLAMGQVPRHIYFDSALLSHAYQDKAFPIGEGQTISQPYTVAFQTQLLGDISGKRLLEIGTGSGYQTCILLAMGAEVVSIEYNKTLYHQARKHFHQLGLHPQLFLADGSLGEPRYAPYAGILMAAACKQVPPPLLAQLEVGGRLVLPLGSLEEQRMVCITKKGEGRFSERQYGGFRFVPLKGKYALRN